MCDGIDRGPDEKLNLITPEPRQYAVLPQVKESAAVAVIVPIQSKSRKRTLKPPRVGYNRCKVCSRQIKQPQEVGPVCLRKQNAAAAKAAEKEQNLEPQQSPCPSPTCQKCETDCREGQVL
jgi:hypothetical protein